MRTRFLLVILDEYSSSSFEFILNHIPNKFTYKSPRVLIGLTDTASTVPSLLKTYKTLLLENALFSLFEEKCVSPVSKEIPDTDAQSSLPDVTSLPDNWSIKNGDALNSVLTLYCSMIGQEWPL
uniref:Uncharacterized protein n=1 Tax=Biomphalaria glabrata TaxID=6526 RepID=A0A2C9L732_BIOGL